MSIYTKIKFLIIFFVSTNFIFGQTDSVQKNSVSYPEFSLTKWLIPDSVLDSRLAVKLAPLSLLNTSIRIGVEYKVKDNWSLYNELGYYFLTTKGALAKFEVKHYLTNSSKNVGNYVSAELYYKYEEYLTTDTISKVNLNNLQITRYEKEYKVFKNIECLTIKYGIMTACKYRLVFDAFAGIGLRLKQATNTLTSDENEHIKSSHDYGPNIIMNQAGFKVYPNFDLGVKIGFRIK